MNTNLLAQGCDLLRLTRQRNTLAREFELTSAEMQLPEIFFPTLLWKLKNHVNALLSEGVWCLQRDNTNGYGADQLFTNTRVFLNTRAIGNQLETRADSNGRGKRCISLESASAEITRHCLRKRHIFGVSTEKHRAV